MPTLNDKMLNDSEITRKLPSVQDKNATNKMEQDRKQTNQTVLQEIQLQQPPSKSNKQERSTDDKIITMTSADVKENESTSNQQSDFDISLQVN